MERRHGTTRRAIIEALRRASGLSADQLAAHLGLTAMAVRKHLAALQAEGLLTSRVERRPVGRPVHLYLLAPAAQEALPQQYQSLTVELLDDLRDLDGGEKVALLFQRRAERAYATLAPAMVAQPFADQVQLIAEYLDEQGFLADWEKTPEGDYLLKEHNCAIYGVACSAPEACACEFDLIQRLLPTTTIEREERIIDGDSACCYRLRPAAATPGN